MTKPNLNRNGNRGIESRKDAREGCAREECA